MRKLLAEVAQRLQKPYRCGLTFATVVCESGLYSPSDLALPINMYAEPD